MKRGMKPGSHRQPPDAHLVEELLLAAWGNKTPKWVRVLAGRCQDITQELAAQEICYSTTVVNQVLKNTYKGNLKAIESAVRGAYLDAVVQCPVLGEIGLHHCLHHQRAKFMATNSMRVRLFKSCRGLGGLPKCPHSRIGGEP